MGTKHHESSSPLRHLVLIGTMGTGKTTAGRLIASRLGWPFWDNDEWLEEQSGHSALEIARRWGPAELHRREAEALTASLDREGPGVVAAAASAVLDDRVRSRLPSVSFVAWLHTSPEALAERLTDPGDRPVLGASPARLSGDLQSQRTDLYRSVADFDVDTTDRRPEDIAGLVLSAFSTFQARGSR